MNTRTQAPWNEEESQSHQGQGIRVVMCLIGGAGIVVGTIMAVGYIGPYLWDSALNIVHQVELMAPRPRL